MKGDIETYFEDGRWKNKEQGSSRAANGRVRWCRDALLPLDRIVG